MSAYELEALLGEWRDLTKAEHRLITEEDWAGVQQQQDRKQDLKQRIERTTGARPGFRPPNAEEEAGDEMRLRPLVAELVALETINAGLVAARRAAVRVQLSEFDRTTEVLRGLNRAYGAACAAHWSSYS